MIDFYPEHGVKEKRKQKAKLKEHARGVARQAVPQALITLPTRYSQNLHLPWRKTKQLVSVGCLPVVLVPLVISEALSAITIVHDASAVTRRKLQAQSRINIAGD